VVQKPAHMLPGGNTPLGGVAVPATRGVNGAGGRGRGGGGGGGGGGDATETTLCAVLIGYVGSRYHGLQKHDKGPPTVDPHPDTLNPKPWTKTLSGKP